MSIKSTLKGFAGEFMGSIAHSLMLDKSVYHDLNDVTIQAPDGTTQIDHVIVSRYGIFVIEAKNMNGWIFGDEKATQWTQSFPSGTKSKFQNPLRQNYRHTKCLSEFLGIEHNKIHSVVMFWGESTFKTPMPPNVLDSGYTSYIKSKTEIQLSEDEVSQIVEAIQSGRLPRTWSTHKKHLSSLKERHSESTIRVDHLQIGYENPKRENIYQLRNEKPRKGKFIMKEMRELFARIVVAGIVGLAAWLMINYMITNMQKQSMEHIQQAQQRMAAQQAEALKQAQAAENLRKQQATAMAQQPKYEQVLVRGKSARECARPDGTLDNYTVKCMSDHYEMVLANGHP